MGAKRVKTKFHETPIADVFLVESLLHEDDRGAFGRLYCANEFEAVIGNRKIAQVNQSRTRRKGAIRGLHFQNQPQAETKIVTCTRGRVFDVAVDLRRGSSTFLHFFSIELNADTPWSIVIPEGCAHGFQALEDDMELLYLHTEFYNPELEGGIRFDDALIGINWPMNPVDISARDLDHECLREDYSGIVV